MPSHRTPPRSALVGIFVLAAILRIAYVAWAPGMTVGDDFFYVHYAAQILNGNGYTEPDGSPAVFWMPGWPLILAAVSSGFGPEPRVAMFANAVFGAATACLIAIIGGNLIGRRTGVLAGFLYAIWPGTIYFTATVMVETTFNFFLCLTLAALSHLPLTQGGRRTAWLIGGALAFGVCALLKAEPLVLTPFLILFLWTARQSLRGFATETGMLVLVLSLVLGGWVYRNYEILGYPMVTSATGGLNFWIGNHAGATGGNDWAAEASFRKHFQRPTIAATNLAQNEAGWRIGGNFVRSHPQDALRILPNKLALTYKSDSAGAGNLAGADSLHAIGVPISEAELRRSRVPHATRELLANVADRFWIAVLVLAASGLAFVPTWPMPSRVLVFGVPCAWILIHLVFIGGARFHSPEAPSIALLAGSGVEGWGRLAGRALLSRRRPPPA